MKARYFISILCAASAVFYSGVLVAQQMTTPGQTSVNEFGAASYQVAIQAPPGVSGMEPKLSLSYNSHGGNGLLGVGWSIDGLSYISRCPKTMAQDGARGTVNLDTNDRYCLDGQRLMLVNGTYGAAGSEYRTERDTFSKITAVGAAGNGPASFLVKSKAGLTMEYGNTADSRIEAQGSVTVRVWAINRISDAKNNYITAAYTEDNAKGDFYVNRIDYTGNSAQGKAPFASVRFVWDTTRTDKISGYLRASLAGINARLSSIKTYVGEAIVKDYRLTYEQGSVTGRSRLKSLTECDVAGVCLPAISFGWWDPGVMRQVTKTYTGDWRTDTRFVSGDFNGDGIIDLYMFGKAKTMFCAGPQIAASNNCLQTSSGTDWYTNTQIIQGDYNNDGFVDFLMVRADGVRFCDGKSLVTSFSCVQVSTVDYYTSKTQHIGDFDGDGKLDLLVRGNGIQFCTGLTSSLQCTKTSTLSWGSTSTVYGGDFDADGKSDALVVGTGSAILCRGSRITVDAACKTLSLATNDSTTLASSYDTIAGDFNGDGNADIIIVGLNSMYFCAGPGFVDANNCVKIAQNTQNYYGSTSTNPWVKVLAPQVGDFNGDGATDLYFVVDGAIYLCRGPLVATPATTLGALPNGCQGVATPTTLPQGGKWNTDYVIHAGDFNGDGTTDLYLIGQTSSSFFLHAATIADLMNKVTDGLGIVTTIGYAPISNVITSVYTKDSGANAAVSPQYDIQYPMYVVNRTVAANPGGTLTTDYVYGGLKAEWGTGRGTLGFRYVVASEANTGLANGTVYSQTWPYIGMPVRSVKWAPTASSSAGLINQVDYINSCLNTQTGVPCTNAAGSIYFPYTYLVGESSWDLTGAALPVVVTQSTYDRYGNATQVVVVTSGDGSSKTTNNIYSNDTSNWVLGRLLRSSVTSVAP